MLLQWLSIGTGLVILAGRCVIAAEVILYGNSPQFRFSSGNWDYSPEICPDAGFLAVTAHGASVSLIFKGTSVSVGLLKVHDGAKASIYLDDTPLVHDLDLLDSTAQYYQCGTRVVNSTELPYATHNVTIVHSGISPNARVGDKAWLVLIQLVYTVPDPLGSSAIPSSTTSTSSPGATSTSTPTGTIASSKNLAAIIGGPVGGLAGGLILGLAVAWYILSKRRQQRKPNPEADPADYAVLSITPPHTSAPPSRDYTHFPVTHNHTTNGSSWDDHESGSISPSSLTRDIGESTITSYASPPPRYDYGSRVSGQS